MSCSRLLELMLKAAVTEKTPQKEFGANFSPVETKKRIEPAEKMPPISKLLVFGFFFLRQTTLICRKQLRPSFLEANPRKEQLC